MKKKKNYTYTILFITCFICNNIYGQDYTTDYIALSVPKHYFGEIYYVNSDKKIIREKVDSLPHNKQLLESFSNMVSNVTVYEIDIDGNLNFLGVGISSKNKNYQVIYDFSLTQTVKIGEGQYDEFLVGVSVRMIAKFKSNKAGINIASPFSLSSNMKKIEGSLEIRVSGVGSQKIHDLIPSPSDLSPSSIANALQAVATIKSHLYDDETIVIPQVLAFSKSNERVKKSIQKMGLNLNK